jgi:hypothetical protein
MAVESFITLNLNLSCKYCTELKSLANDKLSSLFVLFISEEENSFCKTFFSSLKIRLSVYYWQVFLTSLICAGNAWSLKDALVR